MHTSYQEIPVPLRRPVLPHKRSYIFLPSAMFSKSIFFLVISLTTLVTAEYNANCGKIGGPPIADGSDVSNALAVRKAVCGGVASSNECNWCTSEDFMYTGTCSGGCCQNQYQTCAVIGG
ncbi:hypothetical protein GYMLUDRAFT_72391 [Collybiopsis luxurians FD-317 M1]|uniref:Uncharacterized protein n=1 Tax=Collybiopsis luxurians FD-317 M1 TaxID=944289 RepID=A0A0D0CUG5_9AGAR|nr:hypothetical protein GYMLUDRAFT_72391 [Collybiopsis luxurians FD-317 M1]